MNVNIKSCLDEIDIARKFTEGKFRWSWHVEKINNKIDNKTGELREQISHKSGMLKRKWLKVI